MPALLSAGLGKASPEAKFGSGLRLVLLIILPDWADATSQLSTCRSADHLETHVRSK